MRQWLTQQQIDMDKLAESLQKLSEDNLLSVVQMIHDNKTEETYTKNDVERKFPQYSPSSMSALEANSAYRGRISCRPIHPSRHPCTRSLELLSSEAWNCLRTWPVRRTFCFNERCDDTTTARGESSLSHMDCVGRGNMFG